MASIHLFWRGTMEQAGKAPRGRGLGRVRTPQCRSVLRKHFEILHANLYICVLLWRRLFNLEVKRYFHPSIFSGGVRPLAPSHTFRDRHICYGCKSCWDNWHLVKICRYRKLMTLFILTTLQLSCQSPPLNSSSLIVRGQHWSISGQAKDKSI